MTAYHAEVAEVEALERARERAREQAEAMLGRGEG